MIKGFTFSVPARPSLHRIDFLLLLKRCASHADRHMHNEVKNIQEGREQIFPCECPAVSSLFDASAMKTRKGRTGAWAVHRLAPNELPPFLAKRRKRFARTVVAATNTQAWQITPVA